MTYGWYYQEGLAAVHYSFVSGLAAFLVEQSPHPCRLDLYLSISWRSIRLKDVPFAACFSVSTRFSLLRVRLGSWILPLRSSWLWRDLLDAGWRSVDGPRDAWDRLDMAERQMVVDRCKESNVKIWDSQPKKNVTGMHDQFCCGGIGLRICMLTVIMSGKIFKCPVCKDQFTSRSSRGLRSHLSATSCGRILDERNAPVTGKRKKPESVTKKAEVCAASPPPSIPEEPIFPPDPPLPASDFAPSGWPHHQSDAESLLKMSRMKVIPNHLLGVVTALSLWIILMLVPRLKVLEKAKLHLKGLEERSRSEEKSVGTFQILRGMGTCTMVDDVRG